MEYRYKKHQIFKKKLDVPSHILNHVYDEKLTIKELIEYDLIDKIPLTCLDPKERALLEKFGIEQFKNFDWELLTLYVRDLENVKTVYELFEELEVPVEDLTLAIYEYYKDKIAPTRYTPRMKEVYKNRFFPNEEVEKEESYFIRDVKSSLNYGTLKLSEIIYAYDILKDKDLSYCLANDEDNTLHITQEQLAKIMETKRDMIDLLRPHFDISEILNFLLNPNEEFGKKIIEYFQPILFDRQKLLAFQDRYHLTNEQYKLLFKYFSLEDFLAEHYYSYPPSELVEELKTLPENYIFDSQIPFVLFSDNNVLDFLTRYGLQNTVEFDRECGGFFTKNDCYMLSNIYRMYIHYGIDAFRTKSYEEDRGYNKDEFYRAIRAMIVHGPTASEYRGKAPNYRDMTGEFRTRNQDMFIDEEAPQELQDKFYKKELKIIDIIEHPEYIKYLEGKDLSSCFPNHEISVIDEQGRTGYSNLYKFLLTKYGFEDTIKTIVDYYEQIEHYYDYQNNPYSHSYFHEFEFQANGTLEDFHKVLNDFTKHMILKEGKQYPEYIPESFRQQYPSLMLDPNAPQELQQAFYTRTITGEKLKQIPNYREYLKTIEPDAIFKYIPVRFDSYRGSSSLSYFHSHKWTTFNSFIVQRYGYDTFFDIIEEYSTIIETLIEHNGFHDIIFYSDTTMEEIYELLNNELYKEITNGEIKYSPTLPKKFQEQHPELFIEETVPEEIKNKFYNREFTIKDFQENPDLLNYFTTTNVACGLPLQYSWLINIFENQNIQESNINRLKILDALNKINDYQLQETFKKFVISNYDKLDYTNLDYVAQVLYRLSHSNSAEIYNFRNELATQILATENPLDSLERIEEIFLKNNLPTVGKIYSAYEILHPNFAGFDTSDLSKMSPTLKHKSVKGKQITLFSDLLKAAFGSNNLSIKEYLDNIEKGYTLYQLIQNNQVTYDELSESDKHELITFRNHLITLYNNTLKGKKNNKDIDATNDIVGDITNLRKLFSPNGSMDYNLADRVISMYCHFAGFDTLADAKKYFEDSVRLADMRNRASSKVDLELEEGDFLKGIGDIKYLRRILQNGSVSKEFLGASASSDATPLDTDISMITKVGETTEETILGTSASNYGNIIFVLKHDDRFVTTRTSDGTETPQADKLTKLEVFYTGVCNSGNSEHYGIRTGFASTNIDYIITNDERVFLEIALNGFYIPVVNKEGKIIFTPKDYDELRSKMAGLSHYGITDYQLSENLNSLGIQEIQEQIAKSDESTKIKREIINKRVAEVLQELGLTLKTQIDGDISEGSVELIDTGSTGRGTNKPFEGDFDFMMRLDKSILNNSSKLAQIKTALLKGFGKNDQTGVISTGDFRLKGIELEGVTVDIDITFTEKTDKISYSTDMALLDRLETIKRQHPEQYSYVIANILLAKQVLKEAGVYKPNRGETPQGGLGGVGIENWVLQHGGSFLDASISFLRAAKGKTFEEFQEIYKVWDFGENHLAERCGHYIHDNFITGNMSEEGYYKMQKALINYIKEMDYTDEFDDDIDTGGGISV